MFNFKDSGMGRLFIFQNNSKLNSFIRNVAMPEDGCMVFEKRSSSVYKLQGGPYQAYTYSGYSDEVSIIYHSADGKKTTEHIDFHFNNKEEALKRMLQYSEICIISLWGSVDDYFMSVYNYLFSLSETNNNCLPITVCDDKPEMFDNRVPLNDYLHDAARVRRYRNKEYMNIAATDYFKTVGQLDLNFDDIILIKIIDSAVSQLTNCPTYFLNNHLVSGGLFTIDESFKVSEKFYMAGYLKNYDNKHVTCVHAVASYEEYQNHLLKNHIDYKHIYDTFENASQYEHNQFKTHIHQYFAKLANNYLQEIS